VGAPQQTETKSQSRPISACVKRHPDRLSIHPDAGIRAHLVNQNRDFSFKPAVARLAG
jgi:hypothetical protein